jgi:hypothetical protein
MTDYACGNYLQCSNNRAPGEQASDWISSRSRFTERSQQCRSAAAIIEQTATEQGQRPSEIIAALGNCPLKAREDAFVEAINTAMETQNA